MYLHFKEARGSTIFRLLILNHINSCDYCAALHSYTEISKSGETVRVASC